MRSSFQSIRRDENGRVMGGSVLNPSGRPRGIMNYGGKHNKQMREFFLTKFYEKVEENWEMIFDNLFDLCKEKNVRALLGVMDYIVPKVKEKDVEISPIIEGTSTEEIKAETRERLTELNFLITTLKANVKAEEKSPKRRKLQKLVSSDE